METKRFRASTTPRTIIASYLVTRKVNLRKSARSAALTQYGENCISKI